MKCSRPASSSWRNSIVLDNPNDDGTKSVFDPSIRGKTDQFILKFRKPG